MSESDEFSLKRLLDDRRQDQSQLFEQHVNPQFAKVLQTIGFDRTYVHGEGSYLWDDRGEKYLDLISGFGMFNVGRNHPVIQQTVEEYTELNDPWKVSMGLTPWPGLLGEALLERVPHLDKVYFANSGTECVEAALKFARGATGRKDIAYCSGGFHGLTYGSLSVNSSEYYRDGFGDFLPGPVGVPLNDLEALERAFDQHALAGLLIEPVQGKGVYPATPEYLLGAQELCRRNDALLIVDEVQTGMGRTGELFSYQHVPGLEPDLVLVAKSLSGGMVPVGAVLMRDAVYENVYTSMDRSVIHGSTFGQGGLPMACGLASLHVLESDGLIENAASQGAVLQEELQAMVAEYDLLRDVRGQGLMIGIELGKPEALNLRTSWSLIQAADRSLFPQSVTMPLLDQHNILTQVAGHDKDVIKLLPPLTIDDADVEWFLDAFEETIDDLHRFLGPLRVTARHLSQSALKTLSGT